VSTYRLFPVIDHTSAIYCSEYRGPYFGNWELAASNEPFNGDKNCRSYANRSGYMIPLDEDGMNALTRSKGKDFAITELEVWEVQLSPEFNKEDYLKRMDAIIDRNIETYGKFKQEEDDGLGNKTKINYIKTINKRSTRYNK
jgi:hypothetical protein